MQHDEAISNQRVGSRSGFTLLELLVGMGVMSILIAAFVTFFGKTLDFTKTLDIQNELLADGQIAQQIAASRLQEGWHVWANGTSITLTLSPNAWMFQNPTTGSNTFTTGSDPILALTLPPKDLNLLCDTTTPAGCYRFYAVYAIKRSVYVDGTASTLSNRLLADPANPNAWVMMQVECTYAASNITPGSSQTVPSGLSLSNCQAHLLADYLAPVVSGNYTPFGRISEKQVRLDLRLSRSAKGRTFSVGSTNNPLRSVILLRNQGINPPTQGTQ